LTELGLDDTVRESLDAAYDSGVVEVDALLGQLLNGLEASGQRDNTIIVVVGDHGEALGDSGRLGHDNNLDDSVVRVPFVWVDPSGEDPGSKREADVGLIDIMPTILSRVGATVPVGLDGQDISSELKTAGALTARPIRTQAAALPGMVQRRAVASDSKLDEVINSGNLRLMISSSTGPQAQRRENGGLVDVPIDSGAVRSLLEWKEAADANRKKGFAERVTLSEDTIQQLQAEGYW
jgi:hypothetical protein